VEDQSDRADESGVAGFVTGTGVKKMAGATQIAVLSSCPDLFRASSFSMLKEDGRDDAQYPILIMPGLVPGILLITGKEDGRDCARP
jgi:hypothetical protein